MNPEEFAGYAKEAKKYVLNTIVPKIVVGGVCGAGKSSLLNAVVKGKAFEVDPSKPCTVQNDQVNVNEQDAAICFVDSPGFSEADKDSADHAGNIRRLILMEAHLYLLVIGAPNRSLDVENQWLRTARSEQFFSKIPGLVAINKIDIVPPIRDWNPGSVNLTAPTTQKERNILDYVNYVSEVSEFRPFAAQNRIIPVSAGESFNDPLQYNLELLRLKMFELLPEAAKIEFGRQAHLHQHAAQAIVQKCSLAVAAEVLINPLGLGTDAAIIVPMQIAMIVHIAKVYGQHITWTFASSLLGTVATTLLGRAIFGAVVSMIPVLKNVAGPPVAYGMTLALGGTVIELFATNKANASQAEIKNVAEKYKGLIESGSQECPSYEVLKTNQNLN